MAKKTNKHVKGGKVKTEESASLESNQMIAAIFSYIGILVLVPLLAIKIKDRDDTIRFHIKQGLVLFVLELIGMVVASIISVIPIIGWMVANLLYLLFLIVSIMAIIRAVQKEKWEIPIVSDFTHMVKLK
jgi:uncharacterized membrane protein